MRVRRNGTSAYGALRRRMIAETELAILIGLHFPERVPRIPRIEVGKGTFSPTFAAQFWAKTLGMELSELNEHEAALRAAHFTLPA